MRRPPWPELKTPPGRNLGHETPPPPAWDGLAAHRPRRWRPGFWDQQVFTGPWGMSQSLTHTQAHSGAFRLSFLPFAFSAKRGGETREPKETTALLPALCSSMVLEPHMWEACSASSLSPSFLVFVCGARAESVCGFTTVVTFVFPSVPRETPELWSFPCSRELLLWCRALSRPAFPHPPPCQQLA